MTTYVARAYGLTDAQCTSLFHGLRRIARNNHAEVAPDAYFREIDYIEQQIRANPTTPGRQARALERVARARAEGMPSAHDEAWAVLFMDGYANAYVVNHRSKVREIAQRHGMTPEEVQAEFEWHLHNTPRQVANRAPRRPDGVPNDPASRWAHYVIENGVRCETCGRFTTQLEPHACPGPAAQTPVATPTRRTRQTNTTTPTTETAAAVQVQEPDVPDTSPTLQEGEWENNVDAFQDFYDKARERIDSGDTRLPSMLEREAVEGGVTGGLAAPPDGMTFGIELEVDFPDDPYPYRARRELAERLYEEGISQYDEVGRWHFVGGEGQDRPGGEYGLDPNGWVCEFDRTVDDVDGERGVEIKSQILHDTPRTWRNLRRICEIVEELGGRATARTGLHINIGGADFDNNDPAAHNRLLRMSAAYDDMIVRMATNPESGEDHRGRGYCRYTPVPPAGFATVSQAIGAADHYSAVNLGHLPNEYESARSDTRVEYRVFDSTLDPARIQAAVNLSLGLTRAALSGETPPAELMPAGTSRSRFGSRRLSGERWSEATKPFRQMIDMLSRQGLGTSDHRAQFTHMFAAARWPRG